MQLVALLSLIACASAILTFQVDPKQVHCFTHVLTAGEALKLDLEVIRGGLLDIKLKIEAPQGRTLLEKIVFFNSRDDAENEAMGKVEVAAKDAGAHKICFDNRMSRWTAKVVSFHLDGSSKKKKDTDELAKLEHLGPVVDSVINIADKIEEISKLQHHMRVKEQTFRDRVSTTNWRVKWMAIGESVIMFSIAFAQVRSIQGWFKGVAVGGPRRGAPVGGGGRGRV